MLVNAGSGPEVKIEINTQFGTPLSDIRVELRAERPIANNGIIYLDNKTNKNGIATFRIQFQENTIISDFPPIAVTISSPRYDNIENYTLNLDNSASTYRKYTYYVPEVNEPKVKKPTDSNNQNNSNNNDNNANNGNMTNKTSKNKTKTYVIIGGALLAGLGVTIYLLKGEDD